MSEHGAKINKIQTFCLNILLVEQIFAKKLNFVIKANHLADL